MTMHPHAAAAIRAAKNRHRWGPFATFRYIVKQGVPFRLANLAIRLEAEGRP